MTFFEHPGVLWLLPIWLVFWWLYARGQRRAVDWIDQNVAPRFRRTLTSYTLRSLPWHMTLLLVMGLLLIAAAARPRLVGKADAVSKEGRVLLVLDASASMNANDVKSSEEEKDKTRFEEIRGIAQTLARELADHRFALVTYSGTATLHLPMTGDRVLLEEALRTVEVHNFYQNTGSSLAAALDNVFHFIGEEERSLDGGDLQVVLLSDGEMPYPEDYDDPLQALVEQEIPVHGVTVGSLEGQNRVIYDFKDVVAKKEERRVLREYTTRRVDEHLQRIVRQTGGFFSVAQDGVALLLATAIKSQPPRQRRVEHEDASTDLSFWPVLFFSIFFLFDALVLGYRPEPSPTLFEVERLGDSHPPSRSPGGKRSVASVAVLLLATGCGSPLWWAYRENERGIDRDAFELHEEARPFYERSIGYRVESEIPTYNLGRSMTLRGEYAEAHDLFQEALKLEPDLVEAYFNDGVALYRWGDAERDPRGCEVERTLDLWKKAKRRFATTAEHPAADSDLAEGARANVEFLQGAIEDLEMLVASPPPECTPPPPPPPSGGGGGTGESQDNQEPPPPSGPPPAGPPPPSSGAPPPPLSGPELQQIGQELERIAQQGREPGKYHRRTRPEQFGKESWSNPEAEIWW